MPFGIMAIANHFNENKLLAFAEALKWTYLLKTTLPKKQIPKN
jgi:Asp-tRNA(Asn)/Glu-tRNA(Gln) amidotransferase A subunit family amidase